MNEKAFQLLALTIDSVGPQISLGTALIAVLLSLLVCSLLQKWVKSYVFLFLGLIAGGAVVWYGLRPYSVCSHPSPDKPGHYLTMTAKFNDHLWDCYLTERK